MPGCEPLPEAWGELSDAARAAGDGDVYDGEA